jgi:DNA-binding HxlR family transcriptional regulator
VTWIAKLQDPWCSVARTLAVLDARWTLLILREAFDGTTRFETFRENLVIAPDVLSDRLRTLVRHGIMTRADYREPNRRARVEYLLTDIGQELHVVIAALQQWGDTHLPTPTGPNTVRRIHTSGERVRVAFVADGREVPHGQVVILRSRRTVVYLTWFHWENDVTAAPTIDTLLYPRKDPPYGRAAAS